MGNTGAVHRPEPSQHQPSTRATGPTSRPIQWLRHAALGAVLSSALLGCGGGGESDGTSSLSTTTPTVNDAAVNTSGYTLGGTLTLPANTAVDSDLNDVNQLGWVSNDDPETAQELSNPVLLTGTVNDQGKGPAGNTQVAGDLVDTYVLDLKVDDVVELEFSGGETPADLDLYLLAVDRRMVGASDATGPQSECIRVTEAGRYYLQVVPFRSAAVYKLRVGPLGSGSGGCQQATVQASFEPGVLIAQDRSTPASTQSATATTRRAQTLVGRAGTNTFSAPLPRLITLPSTSSALDSGLRMIASNTRSPAAAIASASTTGSGNTSNLPPGPQPDITPKLTLATLRYAKALQSSGAYTYVQPNWLLEPSAATVTFGSFPPSDPFYARQRWHHEMIEMPQAMAAITALSAQPSQRPIIAVIDTGVMLDHPDLQAQLASTGRTFVTYRTPGDGNSSLGDDQRIFTDVTPSHGTHVAGLAAAETFNGLGVASVAPMARVMPLNVFGRSSAAKTLDIIQAMLYAAGLENNAGVMPSRRADIINLSVGSAGTCSAAFQDAVNRVRAAGTLVVSATGSRARNDIGQAAEVQQPANCSGVIAVGAVDMHKQLPPYANTGPTMTLTAPGGNLAQSLPEQGLPAGIFSTLLEFDSNGNRMAGYAALHGTSMAAPQVSGILALMLYLNPALTPADIDTLIGSGQLTEDLGTPGRDNQFGWGLLSANKAVAAALRPRPSQASSQSAAARIGLLPSRLDLGSLRTNATLDVTALSSADTGVLTVKDIRGSSTALTISPTDSVDTQTGLGRYLVTVDRRQLPSDGTHQLSITVTLSDGQQLRLVVTVERSAGSVTSGANLGPVYVTLTDPDTGRVIHKITAQANQGRYVWQVTGYTAPRVTLKAGTDPNNDGVICGPAEACASFTVDGVSVQEQTLTLTGDRLDLNMGLSLVAN